MNLMRLEEILREAKVLASLAVMLHCALATGDLIHGLDDGAEYLSDRLNDNAEALESFLDEALQEAREPEEKSETRREKGAKA